MSETAIALLLVLAITGLMPLFMGLFWLEGRFKNRIREAAAPRTLRPNGFRLISVRGIQTDSPELMRAVRHYRIWGIVKLWTFYLLVGLTNGHLWFWAAIGLGLGGLRLVLRPGPSPWEDP